MQDLNDKVTGGSLSASEWNEVPSELQNIIVATGQSLSGADLNQVGKAVAAYAGGGDFFTDNGSANVITLLVIGTAQSPAAYRDGLRARFIAGNTNSGATTIQWPGLGVIALRDQNDVALSASDIVAGIEYEATYRASTGRAIIQKPSALTNELPRNFIDGLTLSNNTLDAVNDIDIAVGTCKNSANDTDFVLSSALGKRIDAAWAEGGTPGAAAGGFPTGITLTNNTWYRVFAIWRATGQIDAGFDTSASAANLLADATNYTKYRQVGWIRRATALNRLFFQTGDSFIWDVINEDFSGSGSTIGAVQTVLAPPDANCIANLCGVAVDGGVSYYGLITATRQTNTTPTDSINNIELSAGGAENDTHNFYLDIPLDGSSQIRQRLTVASTINIRTIGWVDPRGKQ